MDTGISHSYRWKLVSWLTVKATELSGVLLRNRNWKVELKDFEEMDPDSLGGSYYSILQEGKIKFKPQLVRHDIKHVLLGYTMDMPDELRIHAFLIGNKSYNPMAIVYLAICLLIVPEAALRLREDYRRGRKAVRLSHIPLDTFLKTNLDHCRSTFKIEPC